MACTIKAGSRVGCSTERREGGGSERREGGVARRRGIELEREEGCGEALEKMWSETEKKEGVQFHCVITVQLVNYA